MDSLSGQLRTRSASQVSAAAPPITTDPGPAVADSSSALAPILPEVAVRRQPLVAWTSFLLALLQSICGAAISLNGLRLAIGLGALAFSSGAGAAMVRFHADWIRIPMMAAALLGSVLNLAILAHMRHLRRRPAAQWRMRPLTPQQIRGNRLQVVLAVTTLLLIVIEESLHLQFHHTL